jgi:hypothetical protein
LIRDQRIRLIPVTRAVTPDIKNEKWELENGKWKMTLDFGGKNNRS